MTSEWNHGSAATCVPRANTRKLINGIMFEYHPRSGYEGNWVTLNGRVSIRNKRTKGHRFKAGWKVYLDGKLIGNTSETNLKDCVMANDWAIRRGL